ncbi:MAG: nucleoside monophosphate kinase, partial [Cyanobacteria bacterium]|nr:nucleoside monophosphate kinase [Cyanobacteriota bacterium]
MRLILLGGPGAGKGTQAKRLSQSLAIPWISSGDLLHGAIAAQTDLGKAVQTTVEQGEFVKDETMIALMRDRLGQPDANQGWLLDGYPRTAFQAGFFRFIIDDIQQQVDQA